MAPSLKALVGRDGSDVSIPVMASSKMAQEDGPPGLPADFMGVESGPPNFPGDFMGDSKEIGSPELVGLKMGQNKAAAVGESTTLTTATATATSTSKPTSVEAAKATSIATSSATAQSSGSGMNAFPTQAAMIGAIVVIGIIIAGIIAVFFLRRIRRKYKDPKYLPGKTLKNLWIRWEPGYQAPSNPEEAAIRRQARSRANIDANRALDRTTSVRSVITLPAYMAEPDEHEQVIGREGERDGLDTIVVYPETAEEEETRREERMQAMYELRLQRRAQAAEREARRQARTNSGSGASLTSAAANPASSTEQLSTNMANAEAGGARGRSTSDLTAAILNERQRRISEVSYTDVGVVRSDGSKIRSSSTASNTARDSQPLLSQATAGEAARSRSGSVLSLDTTGEPYRRSGEENRGPDLADQRLPPSYDGLEWGDAPAYMSPVTPVSRQSTLDRQAAAAAAAEASPENRTSMRLPVVRITGASNPNSPMEEAHPR